MSKLIYPLKPIEPMKPIKPIKPEGLFKLEKRLYLDLYSDGDKIFLNDLIDKIPLGVDNLYIKVFSDYDDNCCCDNKYFDACYMAEVENKNYKSELKSYDKKMAEYSNQLKDYKWKLGKWEVERDEWELKHTKNEIKLLENKLEKLKNGEK